MRMKSLAILSIAALGLVGCGGGGSGSAGSASSGLNPLGWFSGSKKQESIEPKGGYVTKQDSGVPIARITSARWEPLYEGRLLVVEGLGTTKGWWGAKLVTEVPQPEGRLRPDENGVLRLRFVGLPPLDNTFEAANAAQPGVDTLRVSMTVSNEALAGIREVVITGGTNAVTLRR